MKALTAMLLIVFCFFSKEIWALECYSVENGNVSASETIKVDNVVIPSSAKDDQLIWQSPEIIRNVVCRNSSVSGGEYVYFYPFPDFKTPTPGLKFGIIYNGTEHPLQEEGAKVKTNILVPEGGGVVSSVIKVQVYLKKDKGQISNIPNNIPVYQLDGELGLNNTPGSNFKLSLSNMNNIETADCTLSISPINDSNKIDISDELLNNGVIVKSAARINVACDPYDLLVGQKAFFDLSDKTADGLLSTNKDGLSYSLEIGGQLVTSKPTSIGFDIGSGGRSVKMIDQAFHLDSVDHDWLYTTDTQTTGDKPVIKANLVRFGS